MRVPGFMHSRKVRFVLLLGLCVLTLVQVRMQWKAQRQPRGLTINLSNPPPQWDSGGKVLGNPQNAVSDLEALYKCLLVFRKKFNRYPSDIMELHNDVVPHFRDYGFSSRDEANAIFTNPDVIDRNFPPSFLQHPETIIAYHMDAKRFNGQMVGSLKPPGQHDVLMWTDLYYFPNQNVNWTKFEASTMNPVGFYVVLWDDGRVEKVPFDKTLYVPRPNQVWTTGFPGQAGLPPGCKTFDEFNRNNASYRNWKRTQAQHFGR